MTEPNLDSLVLSDRQRQAAREAIQEIAYAEWQAEGCPESSARKFWLEAESQWIKYCYVPNRYRTPNA